MRPVIIVTRTVVATGICYGNNDLSINGMSESLDMRLVRTLGENNANCLYGSIHS